MRASLHRLPRRLAPWRPALALAFALAPALLLPCAPAAAADPPAATAQMPMLDPWVPPEVRARAAAAPAPTSGAALRAQVEAKLKASFDAADRTGSGSLTRGQAQAAGLGYVVRNFDAIDRHRSGVVRFDDVKRFLQERGARLD